MTRLSLDFVAILVFSPSNVVVLLTVSRWPMCALLVVTSPAEAEPRWPPAVGLLPVNAATGGRYFERTGGSGRPFTFFSSSSHSFIYLFSTDKNSLRLLVWSIIARLAAAQNKNFEIFILNYKNENSIFFTDKSIRTCGNRSI